MRPRTWCLLAGMGLAMLACMPAVAEDDVQPAIAVPEESADACLDYTPAGESEAEPALLLGVPDMEPVAPKPRPCKDQPWCEPRYNGFPRVSCDPCCYANDIGLLICTS